MLFWVSFVFTTPWLHLTTLASIFHLKFSQGERERGGVEGGWEGASCQIWQDETGAIHLLRFHIAVVFNCLIAWIVFLMLFLFQTVADEKRVVDEQRRTLDEEIADFQRRKVGRAEFFIWICAVFLLYWYRQNNHVLTVRHQMAHQRRDMLGKALTSLTSSSTTHKTLFSKISCSWLSKNLLPYLCCRVWFDAHILSGAIRDGQDEHWPPHSRLGKEEIIWLCQSTSCHLPSGGFFFRKCAPSSMMWKQQRPWPAFLTYVCVF